MQESSLNRYTNWPKSEVSSKTCIPTEALFFIRPDVWRSRKLFKTVNAENSSDERFAKCLVSSGKILFRKGFNLALTYVASDELNIRALFPHQKMGQN